MDPTSPILLALLGLVILILAPVGFAANVWLTMGIAKRGGKVPVAKFGFPDLILAGLFAALLIYKVIFGFKDPPRQVHESDLVDGSIEYVIIIAFLCSFIHFRGISVRAQFGLGSLRFDKVVGIAILLLLAVYPLMLCASAIMQYLLGPEAKPQELVKFFVDASKHMNYRSIFFTLFTGTVLAPIAEELIFRGYFYGILKRYLGIPAGIVLNAALFAAVHVNLASLPALFIFAICLTIAYESTGSILVNMCMHSLFNLSQFCMLLYLSPLLAPNFQK